jgi:hypothetical protein
VGARSGGEVEEERKEATGGMDRRSLVSDSPEGEGRMIRSRGGGELCEGRGEDAMDGTGEADVLARGRD